MQIVWSTLYSVSKNRRTCTVKSVKGGSLGKIEQPSKFSFNNLLQDLYNLSGEEQYQREKTQQRGNLTEYTYSQYVNGIHANSKVRILVDPKGSVVSIRGQVLSAIELTTFDIQQDISSDEAIRLAIEALKLKMEVGQLEYSITQPKLTYLSDRTLRWFFYIKLAKHVSYQAAIDVKSGDIILSSSVRRAASIHACNANDNGEIECSDTQLTPAR